MKERTVGSDLKVWYSRVSKPIDEDCLASW